MIPPIRNDESEFGGSLGEQRGGAKNIVDYREIWSQVVPSLGNTAQSLIGEHLKSVYEAIATEPIPHEFVRLLNKLERKGRE